MMVNLGLKKPVLGYADSSFLAEHGGLITRLARLTGVEESNPEGSGGKGLRLTSTKIDCWGEKSSSETARNYLTRLEENKQPKL